MSNSVSRDQPARIVDDPQPWSRVKPIPGGTIFERLTVIGPSDKKHGYRTYSWVQCSCGSPAKEVRNDILKSGRAKSCGCLNVEVARRIKTHGKTNSLIYHSWAGMVQRITNPNSSGYPRYGGRGLDIDPRWVQSFESFYQDMGDRPSKAHSIERKDNSKGYWKWNCCWALPEQQNDNRRPKSAHRKRCVSCGGKWADAPSRFCSGCEAYKEHQPHG